MTSMAIRERKEIVMSENGLPEPKPDMMVKAWGFLLAGRASAVLVALAMVLTTVVVIKLFGH
jgi:hypothetical protein